MSKGIGESYIKRMKHYHLSSRIRSPVDRISVICDRAFYHDGAFKYKLPRFYRDRLYRKKFPCEAKVWNPKLKIYEKKTVYRYLSKNLLALQMQTEVRNRLLAQYNKRFSEFRFEYPDKSDSEICLLICRSEASFRDIRQKDIYSKMSRFYQYNRFKNRQF